MNFLCFGDSLTAGWPGYYPTDDGYSLGNGNIQSQYEYWLKLNCVEYLEKEQGIKKEIAAKRLEFVNKGIPGDTSSGLLHRKSDLIAHHPKPDYSIIIIGTNDLGWAQDINRIISNVKQLHEISKKHGIPSIGGGIPPVTRRASSPSWEVLRLDFNDQIEEYFTKNEILYTKYGYMMDDKGYLIPEYTSGDGVHFSIAGYKQMGRSIFEDALKNLLEQNLEKFRIQ